MLVRYRLTVWILTALTLAGAAGCATAESRRDPATVIADAQCRGWARNAAQGEYASDARAFGTAPQTVVPGTSPALGGAVYGLAGVGSTLTALARQGRESELYQACMTQAAPGLIRPATGTRPNQPSPAKPTRDTGPSCDVGMYWNSARGQCVKIGED